MLNELLFIIAWFKASDFIEFGDLIEFRDLEDFADFYCRIYFIYLFNLTIIAYILSFIPHFSKIINLFCMNKKWICSRLQWYFQIKNWIEFKNIVKIVKIEIAVLNLVELFNTWFNYPNNKIWFSSKKKQENKMIILSYYYKTYIYVIK